MTTPDIIQSYGFIYTLARRRSSRLTLAKGVLWVVCHIRLKPSLHRRVRFNPRIPPNAWVPSMRRPKAIDVRPSHKPVLLNRILHSSQIINKAGTIPARRWLRRAFRNNLRFGCPIDALLQVRIDSLAFAIGCAA